MKQKSESGGRGMNLLFTMLLFLVFVLCALFTVLIGGRVYENISVRMEENYEGNVALSYIANKVRQGDQMGRVEVTEIGGAPVLELSREINGKTYVTWIYYYDGAVRELFTSVESGLGLSDGLEIMDCGGLELSKTGNLLYARTTGAGGGELYLSVRSERSGDE